MEAFYITPGGVGQFSVVVLYCLMGFYLAGKREKTDATWWLAGMCFSFGVVVAGWNMSHFIVVAPAWHERFITLTFLLGQGVWVFGYLCLVQFAYVFRGNPFVRESRIVLAVIGVLMMANMAVPVFKGPFSLWYQALFILNPLYPGWAAIVLLRKTVRFSRDAVELGAGEEQEVVVPGWWNHVRRPRGRTAQGCRAFALLALAFLVQSLLSHLIWTFVVAPALFTIIFTITLILITFGLLMNYVTYASEPTTVQVKLIGAMLIAVLLLLYVTGTWLIRDRDATLEAGLVPFEPHTLLFEPDGRAGYRVQHEPLVFDTARGDPVALDEDNSHRIPIGFAFPFYGQSWDSLTVYGKGAAVFAGGLEQSVWGIKYTEIYNEAPKAVPFYADLDLSQGGVYARHESDRLTLTWRGTASGEGEPVAYQLVLDRRGRIEMRYEAISPGLFVDWLATPTVQGIRGIHPGGTPPLIRFYAETPDPLMVPAGSALLQDASVDIKRVGQTKGQRLLILLIAGTLLVLLVLPYLFRTSLLRPLERLLDGVKQIEAGDLDVVVSVHTQDEIGTLAQHFNHMTYAMRKAEEKLQAYADTLEHKVTERTAALEKSLDDLRAAQAQLIQAEKMASLGALTAGIAHEIKNPLNFVNNFAHLVVELVDEVRGTLEPQQQYLPSETQEELADLLSGLAANAERIEAHGKRADGIVQSMLLHSRGTEGERRPVELNTFIEEYVNLAYHGMRARQPDFNVTFERSYDEEVGQITVVPQELGRVFINLLGNAFDAVYEQRDWHNGQHTPTVEVSTQRNDDSVVIRVADNGPGIPEAIRKKIFEPFFTTKPTGSGTGLGLSLSYDIVTQGHGGTLRVESEEGEGSAFVITLPV